MTNKFVSMNKSVKKPPCAGIIVFNGDNTVIVSTDTGNMSFPKGKLDKAETDIVAAWRELEEETGLTNSKVKLINDIYFDEQSSKGNLSVRYFVGILTSEHTAFTFDETELAKVAWYNVEEALKFEKLKKERRIILAEAYDFYKKI